MQHGTQQRSKQRRANEIAAIHGGKYGKLVAVKGYCCKPRWSIGYKKPQDPPKEFDFNLWLGPAPEQPYHRNLVHYNWHWFWDTGNGDLGNQGIHEIDVARWAIKGGTLPQSVWSLGGRWVNGPDYKDQGQTPNMLLTVEDFGDVQIIFETRGLVHKRSDFRPKVSVEFYTTEGVVRGGRFKPHKGGKPHEVEVEPIHVVGRNEFDSFIRAMRSRKPQDFNVDIEEGHYSSALAHLGNISYRLGQSVPFSHTPEAIGNNHHAAKSFELIKANLQGALKMDLDTQTYQLGPVLRFDPKSERFIDNEQANRMLTHEYRAPFVMPEQV